MANNDDWTTLLDGHPIFSRSKGIIKDESLELSLNSIPDYANNEEIDETTSMSGRRQVMCMKDADLLLASGSEVRMASLGDAKMSGGSTRDYKASSITLGLHHPPSTQSRRSYIHPTYNSISTRSA